MILSDQNSDQILCVRPFQTENDHRQIGKSWNGE